MKKATFARAVVRTVPLLLVLCTTPCGAELPATDLDEYYRFPISVGVEYQTLSPVTAYEWGSPFSIYDLSAVVRVPLPSLPVLQPILRFGVILFDSRSLTEPPAKWDHTDVYAALGAGYAHRFAKYLEAGVDVTVGLSEALYDDLVSDPDVDPPLGSANLLFEACGRIILNPSYNLAIDIRPNAKYLLGIGAIKDFDGLLLSLGLGATFRFGQDPDASTAAARAVRFERVVVPQAFAAMQSWYVQHPIGTAVLVNTEKVPLADVEVSFLQKGTMDSPTPSGTLDRLAPGERATVDLYALFNDAVFRTEGVTPLSGEVIVSYLLRGRPVEQRQSVGFYLYDKRAMTWDDDRKLSALITPDDSALKNYGGFVRQACNAAAVPGLSPSLQLGMQVFAALGEIGCLYQADSELPFTRVQGDPAAVDTVNLARETLKSGMGDCDDLTVLFDSVLESLAVDTGFITVPGHVFAALDTGVPSREYRKVHPDRAMSIDVDGELWIPVEITLVGKTGFLEAWTKGMEEWRAYDATPGKRILTVTRKARELYRPVGLKEADLGLQYGRKEAIVEAFRRDRDRLVERILSAAVATATAGGRKEDWNRLGVAQAQFLRYAEAEEAFRRALSLAPDYPSATINLGNLLFLQQEYGEALSVYGEAQALLEKDGSVAPAVQVRLLLNMAKASYALERYDDAGAFYARASAIDPETVEDYAYLIERATTGTRAAGAAETDRVIFFIEDEP
jgi:hypothetical protein